MGVRGCESTVTQKNVKRTGYWLQRPSQEDVEIPGGGYWLMIVTLEDVESTGGGYWLEKKQSGGCLEHRWG